MKNSQTEKSPAEVYSNGIIHCSVCSGLSREETLDFVNRINPTGIGSAWTFSMDEKFADGKPNPCPCEDDPARRHYLMVC